MMWMTLMLCGALNGHLDCIWVQDPGHGVKPEVCFQQLQNPWPLFFKFMLQQPQYRGYRLTWKECSRERVNAIEA